MGYGFIGFKDVEGANKALKSLQGFVVDGHELHVKFAGRGKEEMAKEVGATGVGSKARTTKMIVKNVPFEATKKDIRDLFRLVGVPLFLFSVTLLTSSPLQLPWEAEIRTPSQKVRLPHAWFRVFGVCVET